MNLCGIEMATPLMNASGTLIDDAVPEGVYGALVPKTVTMWAREGNPPPRLAEVPGGIINSIGLQNPGIDEFLRGELDKWAQMGVPVIVSVGGTLPHELADLCFALADDPRVAGIELNLSCPNNWEQGRPFCARPEHVSMIVSDCVAELDEATDGPRKPLIVKLSMEHATANAIEAADAGADAITLINTVPALTFSDGTLMRGGLSGPVLKYVALRAVYEAAQVVDIPLIGCGGITTGQDVKEFLEVGATAVQIGSASFVRDPAEILREYRACV